MIRSSHTRARLSVIVVLLPFVALPAAAQRVPVWRLAAAPALDVGRSGLELHRVVDAALLASGELAIADAGNSGILIVSPQGQLVRTISRGGEGPGEFRGLSRLTAIADTIVGYDALLSRASVHLVEGTHVNTRALPPVDERPVFFQNALSTSHFVGIVPLRGATRPAGMRRDSIAIVIVDAAGGNVRRLTTREWQFQYTVNQPNASTTFGTPFLGQTLVAAVNGHVIAVPRGGTSVEIIDTASAAVQRVALPVRRRPLDRGVVTAHRDSLLAGQNASNPSADRIRQTFGNRFPIPTGSLAPVVQQIKVVGASVWLQTIPDADATAAAWYVIDPASARVLARVDIPRSWTVLGGDARRIIVRVRDNLGVESVRVYDIVRPRQ